MARKFTYIIECRSATGTISYYTGSTNDIKRRITEHLSGRGARYLQGRTILRVAYREGDIERAIKTGATIHVLGAIPTHVGKWTQQMKRESVNAAFSPKESNLTSWRPAWRRTGSLFRDSGEWLLGGDE